MKRIYFLIGLFLSIFSCSQKSDALRYLNSGNDKVELKDYLGAIDDYSKAIELDPKNVEAYSQRGFVKSYLSDERGAISDHSKVIEIDPNNAKAYSNRGMAKLRLKQIDSGCLDLSEAGNLGYKEAYDLILKFCN